MCVLCVCLARGGPSVAVWVFSCLWSRSSEGDVMRFVLCFFDGRGEIVGRGAGRQASVWSCHLVILALLLSLIVVACGRCFFDVLASTLLWRSSKRLPVRTMWNLTRPLPHLIEFTHPRGAHSEPAEGEEGAGDFARRVLCCRCCCGLEPGVHLYYLQQTVFNVGTPPFCRATH